MTPENYHLKLSANDNKGNTISYLTITPETHNATIIGSFVASHLNRVVEAVAAAIEGDLTEFTLLITLSRAETGTAEPPAEKR
jgi:hypothetical protein